MAKRIGWLEILFWIVMAILFIMIMTKVFGKSATDIQIFLGFFTGLLILMGHIIKLKGDVNHLNREFGEFKIKTINSFKNLKKDISSIKKKLKI